MERLSCLCGSLFVCSIAIAPGYLVLDLCIDQSSLIWKTFKTQNNHELDKVFLASPPNYLVFLLKADLTLNSEKKWRQLMSHSNTPQWTDSVMEEFLFALITCALRCLISNVKSIFGFIWHKDLVVMVTISASGRQLDWWSRYIQFVVVLYSSHEDVFKQKRS